MKRIICLSALLLLCSTAAGSMELTGIVVDPDGKPLTAVSVVTDVTGVGAVTDEHGEFLLRYDEGVVTRVTFSSVGYQSRQFSIAKVPDTVVLRPMYYRGEKIVVTADRGESGVTPIAFENFTREKIERDYTVGEFPLLLSTTTNLYTFSDAGTPLGYSYVRIRGFDDKRVSTYINGVPLNDPEDQATYFVDLPDFAANITDIQVQRGVGNSLYGDASFGGSLNIVTKALSRGRQVSFSSGYGSYTSGGKIVSDIYKQSVEYTSGLINGRWHFSGRFSKQKTGGYRYNSWYQGWAYYFSLARLDPNMVTELYIYGGPMRMHLAFWGVPKEMLETNRRYNPLTYPNETDNFNQPHYQLHNTYRLSERATLSNTLYYIRGKGYYEQLKTLKDPEDYETYGLNRIYLVGRNLDLVRQQWVFKNQYGWNPRLDIEYDKGRHSFGGSFYYFESEHWGQIVWLEGLRDYPDAPRPGERYYEYFGKKWVGSVYGQEYYQLSPRLSAQVTAQFRYQRYDFDQTRMGAFKGYQYDVDWFFFSPRVGLNYAFSDRWTVFGNFAVSSRTPSDASIYDANDPFAFPSLEVKRVSSGGTVYEFGDPTAKSEHVYDFELGTNYRHPRYALGVNLFWMEFVDEIIPYGGVNDLGLRVTVNADRSVHAGIELNGKVEATDELTVEGNFSYNHNRIKKYLTELDGLPVDFSDKTVPGFPEYLGNLILDWRYKSIRATLRNQLVGKQYMELQNVEDLAIEPYYTASLSISYTLGDLLGVGSIKLSGRMDNLFDAKYEVSGYGGNYAYRDGGAVVVGGWAEYYPAAERSFYGEVKVELY
jgi:iron complex outermembrane receptor protein